MQQQMQQMQQMQQQMQQMQQQMQHVSVPDLIVSGLVAGAFDLNAALYSAASNGHGEIVSRLVAAGADLNAPDRNGRTPLYTAASNGHSHATLALLIGGATGLESRQLRLVQCPPDICELLRSPPPAPPPLVAAHVRLGWSKLCHDRLCSGRLLEFVSVDVVACVGHLVGVADVYRARVRQAQLVHELRASTSVDSDDVARARLIDARWDVAIAVESLPSSGRHCSLQ